MFLTLQLYFKLMPDLGEKKIYLVIILVANKICDVVGEW